MDSLSPHVSSSISREQNSSALFENISRLYSWIFKQGKYNKAIIASSLLRCCFISRRMKIVKARQCMRFLHRQVFPVIGIL